MKPEVSIIIVNYKNQHLITRCVKSIVEKEVDLDYEIIVIDNHSEDDTENKLVEIDPKLRWFQMGYNSGFGRANNKGIAVAKGDYVLLLNSDVLVKEENSITSCLNYLKQLPNSKQTILGTRLVNPDGSYQETLRLEFPGIKREIRANPFYIFFVERLLNKKYSGKKEQKKAHYRSDYVEYINGAFLFANRKSLINNQLFFDVDFFLYGEDIEWAWRARKLGFQFYHYHEREFTHIGSASSDIMKSKIQQVMASDWLYLKKTRGVLYTIATLLIIWINQILDSLLYFQGKIRRRKFNDAEIFQRNLRRWIFEILRKYSFLILFGSKYSKEKSFKINCYDSKIYK